MDESSFTHFRPTEIHPISRDIFSDTRLPKNAARSPAFHEVMMTVGERSTTHGWEHHFVVSHDAGSEGHTLCVWHEETGPQVNDLPPTWYDWKERTEKRRERQRRKKATE